MSLPPPHPLRHLEKIHRKQHAGTFIDLPYLEIEVDKRPVRYVETSKVSMSRVRSIFAKEPTTIPWLEAMREDETLVDIGANVGMYSVYAAACTGCRVFSFEPEALNYAELNKNIYLNDLHGRVSAFCVAMGDEEKIDYLRLGAFGYGYSHHDFGENTWTEDKAFGERKTAKDQRLEQGAVCTSLDRLIEQGVVPVPDHIKIDVDGLEHRVIAGMKNTLQNERVKTVLLEVDHTIDTCVALVDEITAMGWRYSDAQVGTNRKTLFDAEHLQRLRRNKKGGFNYIFFRDEAWNELFQRFRADYTPPLDKEGKIIRGYAKIIG